MKYRPDLELGVAERGMSAERKKMRSLAKLPICAFALEWVHIMRPGSSYQLWKSGPDGLGIVLVAADLGADSNVPSKWSC